MTRAVADGLDGAGIDPERVYETNVVKHFKFTREGMRRLHQGGSRGLG